MTIPNSQVPNNPYQNVGNLGFFTILHSSQGNTMHNDKNIIISSLTYENQQFKCVHLQWYTLIRTSLMLEMTMKMRKESLKLIPKDRRSGAKHSLGWRSSDSRTQKNIKIQTQPRSLRRNFPVEKVESLNMLMYPNMSASFGVGLAFFLVHGESR